MDLKEAFQTAIAGEIEGRELYRAAAEKTDDTKAKENFNLLADEEQKHLDTLAKLARDYSEGRELEVPKLPAPADFLDAESPIFSKEFKRVIADKHFEMAALSIGIKLELESEKFYRQMSKATEDPNLRELFDYLADWEKGHYEYLNKQIGFLNSYYTVKYSFFRF
jgi:rubrerythrin